MINMDMKTAVKRPRMPKKCVNECNIYFPGFAISRPFEEGD